MHEFYILKAAFSLTHTFTIGETRQMDGDCLAEIQISFLQEATDLISSAERSFLELEKNPSNEKEMAQLLRLFHNLKGSAAAVSFTSVSELCHKVENLLVKAREREVKFTFEITELLLQCTDHITRAIGTLTKDRTAQLDFSDPISKIENLIAQATVPKETTEQLLKKIPESLILTDENNIKGLEDLIHSLKLLLDNLSKKNSYRPKLLTALSHLDKVMAREAPKENYKTANILLLQVMEEAIQTTQLNDSYQDYDPRLIQEFLCDMKEQLECVDQNLLILEKEPHNKTAIDAVFRGFHTVKSASAIVHLPDVEKLAHHLENMLEPARKKDGQISNELISLSLEGTGLIRQLMELIARADLQAINDLANVIRKLVDRLLEFDHPKERTPTADPQVNTTQATTATNCIIREPIKVDADRLDRLVDSIGELVIAETMVSQAQDHKKHFDRLSKITRNLQELGLALRMVPIRQTFRKMTRIVRDVSKKLNKQVDFKMFGEDTELDRSIAEKIGDPLVHMIRNAIDHGIETEEARRAAGKPIIGHIELRAFHKAGSIWIEIQDDGKGLNKDCLLKKARQKGLIAENQVLSEQETFQLIFASGFSTAEKVTEVSGRGVGMDVVRKNIEDLRGQIDIETKEGKGTLFRIRIPNTLAIIEGMVVQAGGERTIVPTQSIFMAVKPNDRNVIVASAGNLEMLELHGELLPLFNLSRLYGLAAPRKPHEGIILVVEDNRNRIGLIVDQILTQQQFVIKNLGSMMKDVPGISGGTIMPDGQVGLILDVGLLIQKMLIQKTETKAKEACAIRKEL